MPQLQYLANRQTAQPQKTKAEAPQQPPQHPRTHVHHTSNALPLRPPVSAAALFNTMDGYAYQVTVSSFPAFVRTGVCVFSVQRVLLRHPRALLLHVQGAKRCGLPFCVVRSGVTWQDVLQSLTLSQPVLRGAPFGWNVQVLGREERSGGWQAITPALTSPLEARYFLRTDLEVLFAHYEVDRLHMQAAALRANASGADWRTPSSSQRRTSADRVPPPPAPQKDYLQAPGRRDRHSSVRRLPVSDFCATSHPACKESSSARETVSVLPRNLAGDFEAACTPTPDSQSRHPASPSVDAGQAAAPPRVWSRTAFVQQQQRWTRRWLEWQTQTKSMSTAEVLAYVQSQLRQPFLPSVEADSANAASESSLPSPEEKGCATWALSLMEHECYLTAEEVCDACTGNTRKESASDMPQRRTRTLSDLLPWCRTRLHRMRELASRVCRVADSMRAAAARAEAAGVVPPAFPRVWLSLLLLSVRLRCLRHLALVHACDGAGAETNIPETDTAREDGGQRIESAEDVPTSPPPSSVPTLSGWVKQQVAREAAQTAEDLLCTLSHLRNGTFADSRLPRTSLSGPLWTCVLSLTELAAYLSTDTSHRCLLLRACIHACCVRLSCVAFPTEESWAPRCITDVMARMQTHLRGLALASPAFGAYARLTALLVEATEFAEEHRSNGENDNRGDEGGASMDVSSTSMDVHLGYTILHIPSTAAVDDAFVRGNTCVREFRHLAAAAHKQPSPLEEEASGPSTD